MKYLWLLILTLSALSCKKSPADGLYCAEVKYKHAGTARNMTQKLLVNVESKKLTRIVFPEDSQDTSKIIPQGIPDDGKLTVLSEKGSAYYVTMIGPAEKCSQAVNLVQCKGIKKNGERCQRMTDHPSGTCWQHRDK